LDFPVRRVSYKFKAIFEVFTYEDSYSDPLAYNTAQSGIRPIGKKTEIVCFSETLVLSTSIFRAEAEAVCFSETLVLSTSIFRAEAEAVCFSETLVLSTYIFRAEDRSSVLLQNAGSQYLHLQG
jgi:hypothetical protein